MTVKRIFEKSKYPQELTAQQESVLTGLMLGDGTLLMPQYSNASLATKRTLHDRDYNEWIGEIFYNMLRPKSLYTTQQFDKRTNKLYKMSVFTTKSCVVLNQHRLLWYPNGKKQLPSNLKLDALSIAVWFCDDGWILQTTSPHRLKIGLSTNGFTKDEVYALSDLLCKRYNENFTISKASSHKEQYIIAAADSATRTLLKDIDPVFPKGMNRKRLWDLPEVRFYENEPAKTISQYQKYDDRMSRIKDFLITGRIFTIRELCEKIGWIRKNGQIPTSEVKTYYLSRLIDANIIEKYASIEHPQRYIVVNGKNAQLLVSSPP